MTFLLNTEGFDEAFYEKAAECENLILPQKLFQSDKNHSVLARVLLAYALQKVYGITEFSLKYTRNMKPYLREHSIFFNISHSGNYVICTVSDFEVGCDVQEIVEYKPRIAKRYFTEKEQTVLENSENKNDVFTKLWTLKESVLKKDGTGVSGGLDTYCFANWLKEESFFTFGSYFNVWRLDDAYVAVCSNEEKNEPVEVSREQIKKYMDKIIERGLT